MGPQEKKILRFNALSSRLKAFANIQSTYNEHLTQQLHVLWSVKKTSKFDSAFSSSSRETCDCITALFCPSKRTTIMSLALMLRGINCITGVPKDTT